MDASASLAPFIPFTGFSGLDFPMHFGWFLALCTALDLGVVLWILWRRPRRVTLSRVLAAAVAVGVLLILKVATFDSIGLGRFGAINLLWYDLCLVLPIASLAVLFGRARGAAVTRPALACAVLGVLAIPVSAWARFVEPRRLTVETVHVPLDAARAGSDTVRVAVFADLQTDEVGAYEREAVARVNALDADVILIPGDVFQAPAAVFERWRNGLRDLLAGMRAKHGVFLVEGDVDPFAELEGLVAGTGVTLLRDEVVRVQVGDRTLAIAGLRAPVFGRSADPTLRSIRGFETSSIAMVRAFEQDAASDDIRILVAHQPTAIDLLEPGTRVDLLVAGHTHGGQVVVPFYGPPITLSPLPRHVGAGGLHVLDDRRIYISRGVGLERFQAPRIRFLCPPEITLLLIGGAQENGARE